MRSGDPDRERRFLDLVDRNRAALARIARAYAGHDWADLQQDILLQVWKGLDSFEGKASASTWMYRVALNTALTWRRAGSRQPRTVPSPAPPVSASIADAVPEPAGALDPRDPLAVLDDFLATLNGVDRAVLLLYLEDSTYEEIAAITGLTASHVGVRLHRIKRVFKDRYIGDA